ncbi:MAG TPA: EamA family transporter, partial [Catenuloplanes sp.]
MNTATALAVALAVLSAGAYAAGAVAQQRTADPARRGAGTATPARGFGWALAVGGNVLGALLHVLALRYGALSVVQPLGALTLVFAVPLGALALGRRVQSGELLGAGLTVAGLGVLLALTPSGATATALSLTELSVGTAVVAAGVA